jgi:hypothetical protein
LTLVGDRTLALVGGHDRQRFSIAIEQGGAGNFEVTWFAGIRWSGGTVPNLTNTAGKIDVFTFVRLNATTFLAVEVGTNY